MYLARGKMVSGPGDETRGPASCDEAANISFIVLSTRKKMEESIKQVLASFQLSGEKLNHVCSKKHISELATKINRDNLAEALFDRGIGTENLDLLSSADLLARWAEEKGGNATYFNLARTFHVNGRQDLIEAICRVLHDPQPLDSNGNYTLSSYTLSRKK